MSVQQIFTNGSFATEPEAWEYFDREAVKSDAFRIYREVKGELLHPRPDTDAIDEDGKRKGLRVDRLLIPQQKLIDKGWRGGFIIVEGKKSDTKIGPLISQALDYSHCVWELPTNGFLVMVRWVFLWPLDGEPKGDLGSVMAQHRIGWIRTSQRCPLVFGCGGTGGITINADGTVDTKPLPMGRKVGSR